MNRTNKISIFISLFLSIVILVGMGCFLGVYLGSHYFRDNTQAEIGTNKVGDEQEKEASVSEYVSSAEKRPFSNYYLKIYIWYNNTYFNAPTITGTFTRATIGSNKTICWNDSSGQKTPGYPTFTISPKSGYHWKSTTSVSVGWSNVSRPSSYGWYSGSISETSNVPCTRSGNNFSGEIPGTTSYDYYNKSWYDSWIINTQNLESIVESDMQSISPTLSMSSYTYGGTVSTPSVSGNSGNGAVSYYYRTSSGTSGGTAWTSSTNLAPGNYYMYATVAQTTNYYGATTAAVNFKVYVPNPSMTTSYAWTGSQITASTSYNSTYVNAPSGVTGTNVGSYTATFTTKSGYLFNNNSSSKTISWSITKRSLTIPSVSGTFTYDGNSKSATISNMNSTYITQGGTASASAAGTYTVTFTLKNTSTCTWSDSTTAQKSGTWKINRSSAATKPTLKDSGQYSYTGSAIAVNVNNFNSTYMTRSNYSQTAIGNYTATYALNSNYAWTDGTTANVTLSWKIIVRSVAIPTVSGSFTYDGNSKSASLANTSSYYTQTGTASATNAGTYTVYFDLPDTTNYKWSDSTTTQKSGTWTINKASLAIPTISANPTFNGSNVSPTLSGFNSSLMTQSGDLSATDVKTSGTYTLTISLTTTAKANYKWSDGTDTSKNVTWNVEPLDFSQAGLNITIPQTDFIYDGTEKTPEPTVTI